MERLYFISPDRDTTHHIVRDLTAMDIDEDDIAVVARDEVDTERLPEADELDTTDVIPAAKRGFAVGGATGLLAGLTTMALPGAGLLVGGGAVAGMTAAGAAFGTWVSALVGGSVRNSHIQEFSEALDDGKLLMIVNAPDEDADQVKSIVLGHFPQAKFGGVEPSIPSLL